jgi:hypothetical protein
MGEWRHQMFERVTAWESAPTWRWVQGLEQQYRIAPYYPAGRLVDR